MPDAPSGTTNELGLGEWADGKNPGAAALNANWVAIDAAVMGQGSSLPATYTVGKLYLKTGTTGHGVIYRNDGTFDVPSWTNILSIATTAIADISGLQAELDAKALASDLTTLDGEVIKKDGSVAMAAALDFGTHKGVNVANGTNPADIVNKGQLDAAVAAGLGALGTEIGVIMTKAVTVDPLGAGAALVWDVELVKKGPAAQHSNSSNPSQYVCQQAGRYDVLCQFQDLRANGSYVLCKVNGNTVLLGPAWPADNTGGDTWPLLATVLDLALNDVVEFFGYGISSPTGKNTVSNGFPRLSIFLRETNGAGGGDFKADGSIPMTGNLDAGSNKVIHVADGTASTDGVNKGQLDADVATLQAEIDALASGSLTTAEAENVTGTPADSSSGSFATVAGTLITLVLATTRTVILDALGAVLDSPDGNGFNGQLGIYVEGTYYTGTPAAWDSIYARYAAPVSCRKTLVLTAGTYHIYVAFRQANAGGKRGRLANSATYPTRISVTY